MVVGNMGGRGKFTYTVIGDSVNVASRLEGANREFGTSIMVTGETFSRVSHLIIGRELDRIIVKGRNEPVGAFEIMGMKEREGELNLSAFLATYHDALRWYRERAWDRAIKAFTAAHALKPGDRPSLMYIDRSRAFKADPPPASWNGSYVMETK
jgi:adenylate cyclase